MSALKKTQKIFNGLKLIGNFIERPIRVGDIVLNDDGQHLIWGNIEDVVDGFKLDGKTIESNKADLKFTTESNIEVFIGGAANSNVVKVATEGAVPVITPVDDAILNPEGKLDEL